MQPPKDAFFAMLKKKGGRPFIIEMTNETPRELEATHQARFEGWFETKEEAETAREELERHSA